MFTEDMGTNNGCNYLLQEHGLVLFHLGSVWMEEAKLDMARTRSMLPVGSEVGHLNLGNHDIGRQVTFLMRGYKGPDYKALSEEAVLHQVGMNSPLPINLNLSSQYSHWLVVVVLMWLYLRPWLCGAGIGQVIF